MTSEHYPHISQTENGVPCIDGTRHRVVDIAADYMVHGYGAQQIVEQYSDLSHAQVHAALAYYFDHQDEMDTALIESYRYTEKLRKAHTLHPKIAAAFVETLA